MQNYSEYRDKNQVKNTWLHISFQDDVTDSFGSIIPYPHHHYIKNHKLVYCWLIDGFFSTKKNVEFLNDIIARFKITFVDSKYLKHSKDSQSTITPLKLKQFQGLKSKAKAIVKEKYQRADTRDDYVFWCIKLYCEDLIRQDGMIIYSTLEDWAFNSFVDCTKDNSTLRAKCRSTYNWYFDRDWKIGRDSKKYESLDEYWEKSMATRKDHMKAVNEKRKADTKAKIENAITGVFNENFKKQNGTWNAVLIADYLKMQPKTVRKYLKEIDKK